MRDALLRLNDAACNDERGSGVEYTVIVIPHDPKEEIEISVNGKPTTAPTLAQAVAFATMDRSEPPLP
jgi:hypothetical protein